MAVQAPHQKAGPFAGRRNVAVAAGAVAAVLVLVAVVAHVRAGHRSELLQSAAGRERRMQALGELGARRALVDAEKEAFFYGFRAGEETAEKNVMEDEEASMEAVKLANLRKALLHQHEEVSEEQAVEAANYRKAELAEEREKQMAEERRAMLLSEKAADYARAWKLEAEKQAEAAVLRKEAAEARLQQKHAVSRAEESLAKPGSVKASELLAFCAQEFGEDEALQKFCYDKLISKPTTLEAPKYPQQVLREQVIDAPTIQDAMIKAEREGLDTPPQYAELANGELYRVMPLKQALKQHMAKKTAPAQVHRVGKGGVEVDASTLAASVAEAHKMGFKGSPEAVVYHPADGRPVVYKLESPQQSQKLMQMAHGAAGKPKEIEVDSRTLAGSIARAHKMGLQGHPEAIVYHEPSGKTELYEATNERPSQLRPLQHYAAHKPSAAHKQIMAEVKPTTAVPSGEVEVEGSTLKQSLAEARKMGFQGHPQAIVYHPAHGAPATYVLESHKAAGKH